ncbi:MAG: ABC transporter permease [Anaerolineae bacterium]|nr:ABC transporter permease [Anaerolineae bacterium]
MTDSQPARPASAPAGFSLQRVRIVAGRVLGTIARTRELTMVVILLVTMFVMANLNQYFLTGANFRAMAIGFAPTAIISVGMAILLVSGGFDLSVGAVLALSGTVVAKLMLDGWVQVTAIIAVLVMGGFVGLINGLLVTKIRVNPLVATLGTLSAARGLSLVLTEGFSLIGLPQSFGTVGSEQLLGIPYMVVIMFVVIIIGDLALRHTRYLRQVYYIGSNETAARLSGIPVDRVKIFTYMLTATLAALSGVMLASRLMAGTPTAASGMELQVLAASVIGGASLTGGEGSVLGAFLGVVFVGMISNAMTMLAVSIYWQQVITGAILIIAVAIDMLIRRRSTV